MTRRKALQLHSLAKHHDTVAMAPQESLPVGGKALVEFTAAGSAMVSSSKAEFVAPCGEPCPIAAPANGAAEDVTDEENSKMQVWWNRAMCNEMKIPEGYQNVAVLIIKWCKELDELKSAEEVSESSYDSVVCRSARLHVNRSKCWTNSSGKISNILPKSLSLPILPNLNSSSTAPS